MKCQRCGDTKWIGGDECPDCANNRAPETARPDAESVRVQRAGSATLSEAANQALCWLMGEQASRMECGQSRAAILEGFGPKVDDELQAFFCSPNLRADRK